MHKLYEKNRSHISLIHFSKKNFSNCGRIHNERYRHINQNITGIDFVKCGFMIHKLEYGVQMYFCSVYFLKNIEIYLSHLHKLYKKIPNTHIKHFSFFPPSKFKHETFFRSQNIFQRFKHIIYKRPHCAPQHFFLNDEIRFSNKIRKLSP